MWGRIAGSLGVLGLALTLSTVAAPLAPAKADGTFVWGMPAEVDALDPLAMSGWLGRGVTTQIFQGLVKEDLTDPNATFAALKPDLATEWSVSEDGKTYTFKLREGVKFHDGTPLDAAAVKFNLDRVLDDKFEFFSAKAKAYSVSWSGLIDSYAVVDPMTIAITLKAVNYEWLQSTLGATGPFLLMSPESIKTYGNDGVALHPTGTGPFKFVEREQGVKIVLERNDDYWGEMAKLDQVIFRTLTDPSTRVNAMMAGEVQMINQPPWDEIQGLKDAGFVLTMNDNVPYIVYFIPNFKNPAMQDVRVRQALNYGFNREGLIEKIFEGTGTPAYGMLSAGTFAFDPAFKQYPYDPEKAKALLAEAGYPNGLDIQFDIYIYGTGELTEQWFQRDMKAIGVNAKIVKSEWIAYLTAWLQGTPPETAINEMGWGMSIPSWTGLVTRCDMQPPSGNNAGWYCNEKVDELLKKALTEPDQAKAKQYYTEANQIIMDDAAFVPVYHDKQPIFLNPAVKGFVNPPQDWYDFSTVYIEE